MRKNLVVLSCVFPPEPMVSATTSEQVARGLAERGHAVRVVAPFPSRPAGKLYPGYRRAAYARQSHPAGYEITRCFSVPSPRASTASRLLENLVFGFTSAALLAVMRRPDAVYSNTWPIFASGLMALVASLRRIPYVVSVQDVYPESFVSQQRGTRAGAAFRVMRWIDRQVALRARHVIAISAAFAETYAADRGVPRERISVVPNWVDGAHVDCSPQEASALREQFSIPPGAFLVAYGGNIGTAAGVDTLIRALAMTQESVFGMVAGEGSLLDECRRLAGEILPHRVSFFSPWPVEQTMPLYRAADLLVLPTRGSQSAVSVPSKMIRYMLSGRPVLALGLPGTDLARLIEESQCGWLSAPDDPAGLAERIDHIASLPRAELERRGRAGREYAASRLTSQACLPGVIEIIERAAE